MYRFADCELHDAVFELRRAGQRVAVQPKVMHLLIYLVRNHARAVSRTELFRVVWADVKVGETSLSRAVLEARHAIGDEAQEMIATVRGHGFRFAAPVVAVEAAALTDATFIGREAPLAVLGARLEGALGGRASIAWISGIAGIGKTRLLDELATRARARGIEVHGASCHESAGQPAFWAWSGLLKGIVSRPGGPTGGESADAERLAEALTRLTSGAGFAAFDAVTRALVAVAEVRPLVFTIDDVQWIDEGSLELLRFVAREARDARLLVACALRDAALGDDPRSRAIGALVLDHGSVAIALRGLSRDETARMAGTLSTTRVAAAIYERTGGCPLFIRQVLESDWAKRALEDDANSVQTSVDLQHGLLDSIARYVGAVSPVCREVLVWAAVLGSTFDFAPLARLARLDVSALLDWLQEATRAGLVERLDSARYRFLYPLIADVLFKDLAASDRAARHRLAAGALETHFAGELDAHADQIARHYLRAAPSGTAREAYEYSARAARYAAARADVSGAVKHWTRATRVLDLIAGSEVTRLTVLLELARARVKASDTEGAREALFDAAMLARGIGDEDGLAGVEALASSLGRAADV